MDEIRMKKYNSATQQVLLRIMQLSEDTAPVEISFGYIRDRYCHNGLVIKKAPSSVIEAIVNDPFVLAADLMPEGLILQCRDPE